MDYLTELREKEEEVVVEAEEGSEEDGEQEKLQGEGRQGERG